MKPVHGKLPVGVEYDGKLHQDFKLRPQMVEDEVEIYEDPKLAARCEKNSAFFTVCLFARRLSGEGGQLGDIPKEAITPDLLMKGMCSDDMRALQAASQSGAGTRRDTSESGRVRPCETPRKGTAGTRPDRPKLNRIEKSKSWQKLPANQS